MVFEFRSIDPVHHYLEESHAISPVQIDAKNDPLHKHLICLQHMEKFGLEIFEPFFSTKTTLATGLGLGIVKRLLTLYGGKIEVASEEGKGTKFTTTLTEN